MSQYSTGELARLCGVTVRTVQYYDKRGILVPSALTEGGRRLYSEDDRKRMQIICFLRELGLSIDAISRLLSEENPGSVINLLLEQQAQVLKEELEDRQKKLERLTKLKRELASLDRLSLESIGDIAYQMTNRQKLKKIHRTMLLTAVPFSLLEIGTLLLWILGGIWWPFAIYLVCAIPYAVWVSKFYFNSVAYICPQCHKAFVPPFWEAFWAPHFPKTRKLICPSCGTRSYCVEVAREEGREYPKREV